VRIEKAPEMNQGTLKNGAEGRKSIGLTLFFLLKRLILTPKSRL
jgi:hypothetical protein